MNQIVTTGIILSRTDYGEADRIITLLTPEQGKIRLMAKGVRRIKSKLAGGIELFSVSDITFIRGRGEIGTLVSSRLNTYFKNIVKDIDRTMLGYELIKQLNKATEDAAEADYFDLLQEAFEALDDSTIDAGLIQVWFAAQLLGIAGRTPNLRTDTAGDKLDATGKYEFNFDDMVFQPRPDGNFGASEIKFIRLVFSGNQPAVLQKIEGVDKLTQHISALVQSMCQLYIR